MVGWESVAGRLPKNRNIGWTALASAALVLAGCSRPAQVEVARAENRLLVGNGPEPEALDPLFTTSVSALQIQQALFEGLTVPHPETLAPTPGVAERWTVAPGGLVWTFHLREDARWSDGLPVVAADFIFAWQRMLDPAGGGRNASLLYVLAGAEAYHRGNAPLETLGLTARDERTLEVRLAYPAPYFAGLLSHPAFSPLPAAVIAAHGGLQDRQNAWTDPANFVGNGPFVLNQWAPNQYLDVVKNPTYWDRATVRLDGIRFVAIDDLSSEERAFRGGQLHVTEALPPSRVSAWQATDPGSLRIDPYLGVYYILLNHRVPPLDDVAVRRALSAAIDRRAITDKLLRAGQIPASVFTPPNFDGYRAPELTLTPDAGIDRPLPDLSYLFNTSESHRLIAEALGGMWKRDLGLNVTLENVEARTYFDRRENGNFATARASWIGDYLDPMTFLGLWQSGGGGSAWSGWNDPRYDALLTRANLETAPDQRAALLAEAERILLEAQVMIPLYHYVTVYLLRPEVEGWHPTLLDWHPWKHVGFRADE